MTALTTETWRGSAQVQRFKDLKNLTNLSYGDARLLFGLSAAGQDVKSNVGVATAQNTETGRRSRRTLPGFSTSFIKPERGYSWKLNAAFTLPTSMMSPAANSRWVTTSWPLIFNLVFPSDGAMKYLLS